MGTEFQICKMKRVLELCCMTKWNYLTLVNGTHKTGEDGKLCMYFTTMKNKEVCRVQYIYSTR